MYEYEPNYLRTYADEIRCISNDIQHNQQAESDAIIKYNDLIALIKDAKHVDEEIRDELISVIQGIIAEEMKHQTQLNELYTALTGIVEEDAHVPDGT